MGVFALLQTFVPPTLREWLDRSLEALWQKFFQTADPYVYLEVEEKTGSHSFNAFYKEVGVYLSSLRSTIDTHPRLKVFRLEENSGFSFSLPYNEPLEDSFEGAHVWWTHTCKEKEGGKGNSSSSEDERSYTLKFLKANRAIILPLYLDHVSKHAVEIEHRNAQRHLYTNNYGGWERTPFNHPSTFDTLALEANLADRIKADLDTFSKGQQFYHKNGRPWKRGYLLYGPPGTGKSSMIAAIANYLKFDIYDLELTKVFENSELKSLLIQTTRKSIIVIEDIDCTVQFPDRTAAEKMSDAESATGEPNESSTNPPDGGSKLTLSGLLNFTDGLWSCCGEERIFIFTTNHKDRLDPALLRPGRMDMHILLSYCTFAALKKMAINYLGIQDHHMYPVLQDTMERTPQQVTPAAIAELLISNQNDPDAAFKQVMAVFQGSLSQEQVCNVDEKSHLDLLASPKKRRRCRTFFIFSVKSKHTD